MLLNGFRGGNPATSRVDVASPSVGSTSDTALMCTLFRTCGTDAAARVARHTPAICAIVKAALMTLSINEARTSHNTIGAIRYERRKRSNIVTV